MTDNTYNKVINFIQKYHMIEAGDLVAAGVSGGADSVCLLHLLWRLSKQLPFRLVVVHVDHGVRAQAAEDAAYVERLCREWDIPFFLKKVDMNGYAATHKLSPEEAGRKLRYEALEEAVEEQVKEQTRVQVEEQVREQTRAQVEKQVKEQTRAQVREPMKEQVEAQGQARAKIAVAHNAEDRAETMLFHLFRGSGLKGLASIQPVRGTIIRPVLCLERQEILDYLARQNLGYCRDETNETDAYTRNKIRHNILPYARQEICSEAVPHMGELADMLSETERYLEAQAKKLYAQCVEETRGQERLQIAGEKLLREDPVMRKRVLLLCLERLIPYRKDITRRHVAKLEELMTKDGSKELSLPYAVRAYKEYGCLVLCKDCNENSDNIAKQPYEINPPTEIYVPDEGVYIFTLLENNAAFCEKQQNIPQNRYTKWFDYDKITTALLLRTRQQGDYLTIDTALHTKSVKQYMINEKIPKMRRDSMYLLTDGAHVIWVPGYRISQYYKVGESTKRILQVQRRGGRHGRTN